MKPKIEKPELMQMVIDMVKKRHSVGDSPMAFLKNKEGRLIFSVFMVPKEQTRVSLFALKEIHRAEEIVLVQEAWYVIRKEEEIDLSKPISKQSDRKESIVIQYHSKYKTLICCIPFRKIGKKVIFFKEMIIDEGESRFNPFTMDEKELKKALAMMERESIREKGTKEVINLAFNIHIDVYKHNNKFFFECIGSDKTCFGITEPMDDNEDSRKRLDEAIMMIKLMGEKMKNAN